MDKAPSRSYNESEGFLPLFTKTLDLYLKSFHFISSEMIDQKFAQFQEAIEKISKDQEKLRLKWIEILRIYYEKFQDKTIPNSEGKRMELTFRPKSFLMYELSLFESRELNKRKSVLRQESIPSPIVASGESKQIRMDSPPIDLEKVFSLALKTDQSGSAQPANKPATNSFYLPMVNVASTCPTSDVPFDGKSSDSSAKEEKKVNKSLMD